MNTQQGRGILIAFIGGFVLSWDIPFIRLAISNPWMVMLVRGLGLAIALYLVFRLTRKHASALRNPLNDRDWIIVATLHGITNVLFTLSVFTTTTANLVFILAFNPMIAALLGWWMIGEKPNLVTWLAILSTVCGVGLIVGEGLDQGNTLGDIAALLCATLLAYTLVRTRKCGKNLALSPGFGGLFSAVFALPLAIFYFEIPEKIEWLLADGFLLMPLAAYCLALAPKYIPAPQVGMFFLLETVLAPLWVWWLFAEIPGQLTLIGGIIVLVAIAVHSLVQLQSARYSRRKSSSVATEPLEFNHPVNEPL